jgi:hypothetical protein
MNKVWACFVLLFSFSAFAQVLDEDGDGVPDDVDNCLGCWNYFQIDADGDGLGDCWACDWCDGPGTDSDWDGVCDGDDNCPYLWNPLQDVPAGYECIGYNPPALPQNDGGLPDNQVCVSVPVICSADSDCIPGTSCINGACVLMQVLCEDLGDGIYNNDAGEQDEGGVLDAGNPYEATDASVSDVLETVDAGQQACNQTYTRYTGSLRHSPLTCNVTNKMLDILADDKHLNYFAKVGDSITASNDFMQCFTSESPNMQLFGFGHLQSTVDQFNLGSVQGVTPFQRQSLAAEVGQSAYWASSGSPSPVQAELSANNAAYAVIMFGTNDLWYGGGSDNIAQKYRYYTANMLRLLDQVTGSGVIPVLSTIPPHNGSPSWFHDLVPSLNHIVRGLAEAKQIPFMDLYGALESLPANGLSSDGIHLNRMEYNQVCNFSDNGLEYGYNVRNLLVLESLHRIYNAINYSTVDDVSNSFVGDGTLGEPVIIDTLPFTSVVDRRYSVYNSCAQTRGFHYKLDVLSNVSLRLLALASDQVEVPISVVNQNNNCIGSSVTMIDEQFYAGSYDIYVELPSTMSEVLFVASLLPHELEQNNDAGENTFPLPVNDGGLADSGYDDNSDAGEQVCLPFTGMYESCLEHCVVLENLSCEHKYGYGCQNECMAWMVGAPGDYSAYFQCHFNNFYCSNGWLEYFQGNPCAISTGDPVCHNG